MSLTAPGLPRRVGFDGCCFVGNRTGIPNYVNALLRGMCVAHPEVTFYSLSNEEATVPSVPNIVSRVSTPRRRGPIWQNTQLVEMIRADELDVFWGTNGVIPLHGLRKTATVVTIHDLAHRYVPETQLPMIRWKQRVFQPLCAWAADRVVAVSAATAADAATYYRRRPDAVIHPLCGPAFGLVDPAVSEAALRSFALPERFILSVGTLEPRKNIAALIEAHWTCVQNGIALPQLVLVGTRGWFDGHLLALIETATAAGALRYLGYVSNETLAHLYARCTMFVMPSLYEGFGMPILEAQMSGAPVVHGTHASMVEAGAQLGRSVEPTVDALRAMFEQLARGELPLTCRLPDPVTSDATVAAQRMWDVIVDAWSAKQRTQ